MMQPLDQLHSQLTVLKYDTPVKEKRLAISGVVMTPATGCPLPIGFPIVTMSGTTSIKQWKTLQDVNYSQLYYEIHRVPSI